MGPLVFALNPNLGPGFSSRQLPQTTGGMSVQQPNRYASGLEHLLYQPGFADSRSDKDALHGPPYLTAQR